MIDSIYLNLLLGEYKSLTIHEVTEAEVKIIGSLRLNHSYDLVPYSEVFEVEVSIPKNYPKRLPTIKETSKKIDSSYNHVNYDNTLCLEVEKAMRTQLSPDYNLIEWIEKFVFPYFYSYCYHRDYGRYPFGERSHGAKGIIEYYKELFQVKTIEEARYLISAAKHYKLGKVYKGHNICPCGNSKKVRECHGVENLKNFSQYIDYQMVKDLKLIELEESYCEY